MNDNTHSSTTNLDIQLSGKGKKNVFWSRIKRRLLKHVLTVRLLLVVLIFAGLYIFFIVVGTAVKRSGVEYYLSLARAFIAASPEDVTSINGRTNILILGKGGEGHEAPDLTDTIMVASISYKNPQISFIPLPRDIWIKELRAKLNSVYYWGNKKQEKGGLILAKSAVEKLLDEPIQYGVVVDFSGFKKIIDILGNIEVEVEREFTDTKFPIPGRENDLCDGDSEYNCRYETITFKKGKQLMDGETALKFVRSRHAEGDEGTDLARSARQQKVISAIKEKALSPQIIFSQKKIDELITALEEHVETDIDMKTATALARFGLQAKDNINSYSVPQELLVNPPYSPQYDNLYVFIGKDENWKEVQDWVECVLGGKDSCNS